MTTKKKPAKRKAAKRTPTKRARQIEEDERRAYNLIHGEGNALELKDNDEGTDYVLVRSSCWIEVDTVSVWIRRVGDNVVVELCRTGEEADSTLDTASAPL